MKVCFVRWQKIELKNLCIGKKKLKTKRWLSVESGVVQIYLLLAVGSFFVCQFEVARSPIELPITPKYMHLSFYYLIDTQRLWVAYFNIFIACI